MTVLEMPRI